MRSKYNADLVKNAQKLRREMTPEEQTLWYQFLRQYPVRFSRQKILGRYIADFYCAKAKLVIELDGSQHYEDGQVVKDRLRTDFLAGYDLTVLRFTNDQVKRDFYEVCTEIDRVVRVKLGTD